MYDLLRLTAGATALCAALFVGTVAAADPLDTNLLSNPGFESGMTSWTPVGGIATTRTTNPSAHGGMYYLIGGTTGDTSSLTYQTIDLVAAGFSTTLIDSGYLTVEYGGWQAGYATQIDDGRIELHLRNASSSTTSTHNTGWFYSQYTWTERTQTVTLTPGTRYLAYQFRARKYQGTNMDAYLDDAYLIVHDTTPPPPPPAVPEPTTFASLALALGAVFLRRRRGRRA